MGSPFLFAGKENEMDEIEKIKRMLMADSCIIPKAVMIADVCDDTKMLFGDIFAYALKEVEYTNNKEQIIESVYKAMTEKIARLTNKEIMEEHMLIASPNKIRKEIKALMENIDISECFTH